MNKTRAFSLTGAAALAAVATIAALWGPADSASRPAVTATDAISFAWPDGGRASYDLRIESDIDVDAAGDGTPIEHVVAGRLHLRVLQSRADVTEVGFELSPVTVEVDDTTDRRLGRGLARPFVARVDRHGRFLAFHFPEGGSPEDDTRLEEIVRTFQIVLPAVASESWRTEETHAAGTYRARYAVAGGDIIKAKTGYAPAEAQTVRIAHSKLRARLPADGPWLDSAVIDEAVTVVERGYQIAGLELHATLTRVGDANVDTMLARGLDAADVLAAGRATALPDTGTPAVLTSADHARFTGLLTVLLDSDGNDTNAMLGLRDLLREFPELAAEVPGVLRAGFGDDAAATLIHTLQLADNGACHDALAEVAGDDTQSRMDRIRAIVAFGGTTAPADGALEQLWALSHNSFDDASSERADTARLALGRVATSVRASDPARADALRNRLVTDLANAPGPRAAAVALKSLGNTRDPAVYEPARVQLSAPAPEVRAAAALAMAKAGAPSALQDLSAAFVAEHDGSVRASIATALCSAPRSDADADGEDAVLRVLSVVESEPDDRARSALSRFLADWLTERTDVRPVLERLVQRERDRRTLAYVGARLARNP